MSHGRGWVRIAGKPYLLGPGMRTGTLAYLPEQRRAGYPSYADFAAEIPVSMESWHAGFGRAEWDGTPGIFHGYGIDTSIKGVLMLAPALTAITIGVTMTAAIRRFVERSTSLFAVGGRYPLVYAAATDSLAQAVSGDFGAGLDAVDAVVYQDTSNNQQVLYVPIGSATYYWRLVASTWTQGSGMTPANRMAVIRDTLWASRQNASRNTWEVLSSVNGVGWAAADMVGQGDVPINRLIGYDDRLIAITESQLLQIAADGSSTDILPGMRYMRDPANGVQAMIDVGRNSLLIPVGEDLLEWAGQVVTSVTSERGVLSVGPGRLVQNDSAVRGSITALAPGGLDVMYAGLAARDGYAYLLKRRMYQDLQPGDGWCPVARFTPPASATIEISALHVERQTDTANGYPRLWIALRDTAGTPVTSVQRMTLPRDNDNPIGDTGVTYQSSGRAVLPSLDGGMRLTRKVWLSVQVHVTAPTGTSVLLLYALDGSSTFQPLARVTTSGFHTIRFPAGTVSRVCQVRLDLATNVAASTPRVHRLVTFYELQFPARRKWLLPIVIADRAAENDRRTASTIESDLVALRADATPVAFEDHFGRQYTVVVKDVTAEEMAKVTQEAPEYLAMVPLVEAQPVLESSDLVVAGIPAVRATNPAATPAQLMTGAISVPILTFASEAFDTGMMHETDANTHRLTCQTAGRYFVVGNVRFSGVTTGTLATTFIRVMLNRIRDGVATLVAQEVFQDSMVDATPWLEITALLDLQEGDWLRIQVQHGALGSRSLELADCHFEMILVD